MHKVGVGYASVSELEKRYVLEALDSQRLSQGKFVREFEEKFSLMHGKSYGVMSNSGTSALHIALLALKEVCGWDEGTEVLVPAITFIATSNAVLHSGLKVVFVDVDPVTYNINPNEIEKHLTPHTKCIIPVHTFGNPCDMERIMAVANKYSLKVIEDCAEAHFATIGNRTVGSWGDVAAFSTYVAHTITTGVGGITCTSDAHLMEIMRSLIAHGRSCTCQKCLASDGDTVCPKRLKDETDRRFTFVRLGYSYRVGEIEGALGLAQLERKDEIMDARYRNAERLTAALKRYEEYLQLPTSLAGARHSYMMYPIVLKNNVGSRPLVAHLEKCNIETRPMLPLLNQPIYKKIFGEGLEDGYPAAKYIDHNGFYIGCHHGLTDSDIDYIAKSFSAFFE